MAVYIDVHSTDIAKIDEIVEKLTPYSGVCIFIDITNSTDIKYMKGIDDWILLLKNSFGVSEVQKKLRENVIKFIGDAIMFFIPDDSLYTEDDTINNTYSLLEEIFAGIDILKMLHVDELHMKCKVSIHHCKDVYNITFFKGHNDYYGKDIDIAARLLTKAKENSIVNSETFYQKVLQDIEKTGENRIWGV